MGRRLARTALGLGIGEEGVALTRRAFELGMEPRFRRGLDDHHPDYLHTARTAIILMDDAGVDDPVTLAAALVTETRDPGLMVPAEEVVAHLGGAVAALAGQVPRPYGARAEEGLVEALVTAPPAALRIGVAERLDHARHLHLRDRPEWASYHALTRDAYAPAAARVEPALAGRLEWWCATFRARYLADQVG